MVVIKKRIYIDVIAGCWLLQTVEIFTHCDLGQLLFCSLFYTEHFWSDSEPLYSLTDYIILSVSQIFYFLLFYYIFPLVVGLLYAWPAVAIHWDRSPSSSFG